MDPSLLVTWKSNAFTKYDILQYSKIKGCRQWLQQWAFYNTRKFKFGMKRIHFGWSCLLEENLELLAMSSLVRSSSYLPQILSVHIYMTKPLVYACMPFQGQKPLGTEYDLMHKQHDCFSLGVNHKCCINRMDKTWSRA